MLYFMEVELFMSSNCGGSIVTDRNRVLSDVYNFLKTGLTREAGDDWTSWYCSSSGPAYGD